MADTIKINADVAGALQQLDRLSKKVEDVHNNFKDKFDKINNVVMGLGAALTAAGTAVAAFADEITDIAAANDMAISSVLGLNKALQESGGKAENVGRFLQTLSQNVEEVNGGNLKTLSSFERLGVGISDLGRLSQEQIKDKLLANLAEIKDPMERNALATQIFGKSLIGVDIAKFAQRQKELRQEMERFEPSIQAAGDAWDNMVYILGQLKLAFAEAFQPVFKLIGALKLDIDLLVVGFRLLGAALVAMTAASVIAGLGKIVTLMRTLTIVVSKNPLVAIAGALVAIGTTAASYLSLTKDTEDAQAAVTNETGRTNEAAGNARRNQEGLQAALEKQKASLTQIRENLQSTFAIALERYNLELESISLGEQQKKIREEQLKIDEEVAKNIDNLNTRYNALDSDGRQRNKARYEEEIRLIKAAGEEQKKRTQAELEAIAERKRVQEDLYGAINIRGSGVLEFAKKEIDAIKAQTGSFAERIRIEQQFNAVMQERQLVLDKISKMSEKDRIAVSQALDTAIIKVDELARSGEDVQFAFNDLFSAELRRLGVSQKVRDEVISGLAAQRNAISETTEILIDQAIILEQNARRFSTGWKSAFTEYVNNATNAAQQAQRIFATFTQGLEDALMRFFQTGKFGWKDFANTIIQEMMRVQIRQLIGGTMAGMGGGKGGGLLGGRIIPGFLAEGGQANANKPYIVGERGPELFVPNTSGTVVPNNALGGSASSVTYNINAVDAMSFKQLVAQDPSFLYAVTEQGRRRLPGGR